MAAFKLTNAINEYAQEQSYNAISNLSKRLLDKLGNNDEIRSICDEFIATMKVNKRTRAPSSYNFYIRDKMAELKAGGATGNLMKLAIEAWKTDKINVQELPDTNAPIEDEQTLTE